MVVTTGESNANNMTGSWETFISEEFCASKDSTDSTWNAWRIFSEGKVKNRSGLAWTSEGAGDLDDCPRETGKYENPWYYKTEPWTLNRRKITSLPWCFWKTLRERLEIPEITSLKIEHMKVWLHSPTEPRAPSPGRREPPMRRRLRASATSRECDSWMTHVIPWPSFDLFGSFPIQLHHFLVNISHSLCDHKGSLPLNE